MIRTLIRKCLRDKRVVAVATVLVIMAWYSRNKTDNVQFEDEEAGESKPAVLISQRGHSNIPSDISSTHLYEETEGIRLRTISGTGIFSTVKSSKSGFVNAHFWFDLCGTDIRTLRNFPTFPNVPSARRLLPDLNIINLSEKYGKRVFGFIVAPESASYDFRLLASGAAEFWLSHDEQLQNCHKVCHSSTANHDRNTVKGINLQKSRRYYFEILHKHGIHRSEDYVVVQWKMSNNQEPFKTIPSNQLQSYQDDLHIEGDAVHVKSFTPPGLRMHRRDVISQPKESKDIIRERIYDLPYISEELVKDLFPTCPYKPSYLVKNKLKRYGSVWENIYSSIYPTDDSNVTHANGFVAFGNDVLETEEALTIVNMVLKQFQRQDLRNYQLKNIINIESKRGRYLVELQLLEVKAKRNVRFSEYVYLPQGSSQLCYPEGFKWNKTSMVNIIVTSGCNQGKWVYNFIKNMERIYQHTKDVNINVIINDFLSPHADIREALETSHLPNYLLFANTGTTFQKSLGLQQAASSVVDGIVAILDLHLDMPAYLVDDIRKHAVAGFQAYSPVLARMDCGTNSVVQMGSHWEIGGYGLVGIYKEDWDLFGGMNVEEFKNKWGGEDNEMVDRILMAGYEIDRKKVKGLAHYFHTKHGMWNCKRH